MRNLEKRTLSVLKKYEELESNARLIAEFLGWEYNVADDMYYTPFSLRVISAEESLNGLDIYDDELPPSMFEFYTSWDWLMLAIEKILDISFQEDGTTEDFFSIRECIPDINHTYKAVLEFIKQYNESRYEKTKN